MAEKIIDVAGFNRVVINHVMEAEIIQSEQYRVTIAGSDNLLTSIDVAVQGDRLVAGYKFNFLNWLSAPFLPGLITIHMPEIKGLKLTGAGRASLKGFRSEEEFELGVTGAAGIEFSEFTAGGLRWDLTGASRIKGQISLKQDFNLRVTGSSQIDLKGEGRDMVVEVDGASRIDLADFPVRHSRVHLSGASHFILNGNGRLDADLNGASTLEYKGTVTLGDIRLKGISKLKQV
ncbi:MAG TPA: DUF2807 domain-containing protein [Dehalococcoidales bacterium]|nr:DUF2807 domain-containing protein [Dehalococcoidales bacterium]